MKQKLLPYTVGSFLIWTLLLALGLSITSCRDDDESGNKTAPHMNYSDSVALARIKSYDENKEAVITIKKKLDEATNEYRIVEFRMEKGILCPEIVELSELKRLFLLANKGELPNNIGSLKKLTGLWIAHETGGVIPESIGNLHLLDTLAIWWTNLTGPLPESIGNLENLIWLEIFGNRKLDGPIPKSLEKLTKVKGISFALNNFSGTFPIEILNNKPPKFALVCDLNNIEELPWDVWRDDFDGPVPNLQQNRLHGTIPEWVKKTERWRNYSIYVINQQPGYGYDNLDNGSIK